LNFSICYGGVRRGQRAPTRTHGLDEPPVLEEEGLVLDVVAGDPGLDLVAETLELLYLCLEVGLELLLLGLVRGGLHLVVDALEELHAL
jgi:hypothetical protein